MLFCGMFVWLLPPVFHGEFEVASRNMFSDATTPEVGNLSIARVLF